MLTIHSLSEGPHSTVSTTSDTTYKQEKILRSCYFKVVFEQRCKICLLSKMTTRVSSQYLAASVVVTNSWLSTAYFLPLCAKLKQNLLSEGKVISAYTMMAYKGTATLILNLETRLR
jgi:hypothetical protein